VRTWDCKKAESLKVLKHYSPVNSVTIDYDNRYLATASGSKVNVWDLAGGSYFTRLYPKRSTYPSVNKVLFSQDGQKLVAVVEKGELVIWDLRTSLFEGSKTDLRTLKSFPDQSGVVFKPIGSISPAFDIDSSSQELAYASKDNRIRFMKIDFELDSVIRDQIASILKTGLSSCDSCEQTTRDLEFFGDNISTFPKDFKRLAEQRLNAARKGAIVWFKDGGASKIIFYENQLIQEQANSIQN
ncbi:hypothetical protein KKA14_06105, partial [bacterium]|nr:hypothetical protein [bacterium]